MSKGKRFLENFLRGYGSLIDLAPMPRETFKDVMRRIDADRRKRETERRQRYAKLYRALDAVVEEAKRSGAKIDE